MILRNNNDDDYGVGLPALTGRHRREMRALEAHSLAMQAYAQRGMTELVVRGTLTDRELDVNAAVINAAAANEMAAAERMIARAGASRVAQTIAADRINRLMQADDRSMTRGGF